MNVIEQWPPEKTLDWYEAAVEIIQLKNGGGRGETAS
nr:hypothetical protein SHINE37_40920 [Rhizobiaceae bacterium]